MNGVIDLVTQQQAPLVTPDQLELIKKTIAVGASADELRLYLYDCARQGVHPLDKLIFFTKRKGKYTPITSIDFMRIRAAESGEYAGSDDAQFVTLEPKQAWPDRATVTVYRLVQGQRCTFTATARWSEYKPDEDFMWRRMPHTMLAKCAEALALRKGFPKQLAGLYAKEELDQAGSGLAATSATPASAAVPEPVAPDGFDSWLMDLEVVAGEGTIALKAAWTKSKAAYRLHLTKIDPEGWETLKAKAAQMDHAVSA